MRIGLAVVGEAHLHDCKRLDQPSRYITGQRCLTSGNSFCASIDRSSAVNLGSQVSAVGRPPPVVRPISTPDS
jgi:hypothetical protein